MNMWSITKSSGFSCARNWKKDENGKVLISDFNMTRSITYVLSKPNKFKRIDNPNPLDDAECYICVDALKDKLMKYFSKPLKV